MDPLRSASGTEMNGMAAKRKSFPSLNHRNRPEVDLRLFPGNWLKWRNIGFFRYVILHIFF